MMALVNQMSASQIKESIPLFLGEAIMAIKANNANTREIALELVNLMPKRYAFGDEEINETDVTPEQSGK